MGPGPLDLSSEAGTEASEDTAGTRGRERWVGVTAVKGTLTSTAESHFLHELHYSFRSVEIQKSLFTSTQDKSVVSGCDTTAQCLL